ncbi:MAG: hypothetical protein QOF01_189 [Thermomicrobiales bacterium]|nr:hypothetical protein [Thermomicrobiales bacterium]MEA2593720.1 hypothetical protein [Thermomicrobiales bacterium]
MAEQPGVARERDNTVYDRIVVALDGSRVAEQVLPHVETLARVLNVPIHLVRVVDPSAFSLVDPTWAGSPGGLTAVLVAIEAEQTAAGEYLESLRQHLDVRGLRVTFEIRSGPVVDEIVASVRPEDLLALTTHGRTGLLRWFLGSVAEGVMRRSPVPLLLVRAREEDDNKQANRDASAHSS